MDIGRVYGRYLPLKPAQTPAQRSDQSRSFFCGAAPDDLITNRTNAYAKSSRPKLTDQEIDEIAGEYDFQHMTQDDYDAFLDDLVEKGVLTTTEAGYFGYGGLVRLDSADSKVMVVSVAGETNHYSQNTPFLGNGVIGDGDMVEWLSEMMGSTEYSADPEAFGRVRQRCEMYGAIYDVVARATNSPAYAAGNNEKPDIIDQIRDPNSAFYQDMYNRMRVQLEESEEEKKKQAIIDALDAILESLSAKKDDWKKKPDSVTSMAELSQVIDSLDKTDPRKEQLNQLRQQLQNLGIYIDLDVGVKGKDKTTWGTTLTQQLIREENEESLPSIFDTI